MGTKQFNDKTTHRQQAKHSVKTGFVRKCENRIPGLFQDFSFFMDSISSQLCITQRDKCTLFSQKRRNEKAHSISLILTPVIQTGTTTQIECELHLALRRVSSNFHSVFLRFSHSFFFASHKSERLVVFLYFSKTNSYFQG